MTIRRSKGLWFFIPVILLGWAVLTGGCERKGDMEKTEAAAKTTPRDEAPQDTPRPDAGPADAAAGKAIYEKYCHYCHGKEGRGDGPVGIAVSPHPANFVEDTKRMSKTDEELFRSITEGVHKTIGGEEMAMPRWQEILSDKERRDVLAYIRLLSKEGRQKKSAR